jgi:hypothetical protein
MIGLTTVLELFTGSSLYAVAMIVTLGATFGKFFLYNTLRETLPRVYHHGALLACCFAPSVVFWSSSILKESVVMIFLGPLVYMTHRSLTGRVSSLPAAIACFVFIGLIKPYILFAFVTGAAAWLYWHRALARDGQVVIRPIWGVLGIALAAGGVVALGELFPRFAADQVLDSVLDEQAVGARAGGGSAINFGIDPTTASTATQLSLIPLALLNAWFRPSLLDVRNAQMLINAFETTAIMVLGGRALLRSGPAELWRRVAAQPVLIFGLVFALSLGIGVGLASTNFGTLSRYRMPLVPFLLAVVTVWQTTAEVKAVKPEAARPQVTPRRRAVR